MGRPKFSRCPRNDRRCSAIGDFLVRNPCRAPEAGVRSCSGPLFLNFQPSRKYLCRILTGSSPLSRQAAAAWPLAATGLRGPFPNCPQVCASAPERADRHEPSHLHSTQQGKKYSIGALKCLIERVQAYKLLQPKRFGLPTMSSRAAALKPPVQIFVVLDDGPQITISFG